MSMGRVIVWLVMLLPAAVVGYLATTLFSVYFKLTELADLGAPITLGAWLTSLWSDLLGGYQYMVVLVIGYLIAFVVAAGVKRLLPFLALIAYPVAGAVAVWAALSAMEWNFGFVPILGAQTSIGYLMHILAGAIGGVIFEILRPKQN